MSFDETRYDIQLNGQGYRTHTYLRDDAPDYVPRLNTGSDDESSQISFKTKSLLDFEGGMFQQKWRDDQRVAVIKNGFFNPYNKKLYPTPAHSTIESSAYRGEHLVSCNYNGKLYVACQTYDTGWKNAIYKVVSDVYTAVTIPAGLSGTADPITDMVVGPDGNMWIYAGGESASSPAVPYYMDTSETFTATTGADGRGESAAVLGDTLYKMNAGYLFSVSTTDGAGTQLDIVGKRNVDSNFMTIFNNAIFIGKADGLFMYDGTFVTTVIDDSKDESADNYNHYAHLFGWLYINRGTKIYRFNGITYEYVVDLGLPIVSMSYGGGRIWVMVQGSTTNAWVGKDEIAVDTPYIYCFDGVGWFIYNDQQSGNNDATLISYYKGALYTHFKGVVGVSDGSIDKIDVSSEFLTGDTEIMEIQTSEFEADLPNVLKSVSKLTIKGVDGGTSDTLSLYVRYRKDSGWSSYSQLVNAQAVFDGGEEQYTYDMDEANESNTSGYALQFKWVINRASSGSDLGIDLVSHEYLLHPPRRWRWELGLQCYGADDYSPEFAKDGSLIAETAKSLRDAIYDAHRARRSVSFVDIDYAISQASLTSGYTGTLDLDSASLMPLNDEMSPYFYVLIDDEVIKCTRSDSDTINIVTRGMFGTTAAAHNTKSKVYPYYRVHVRKILAEQFILDENTTNKFNPIQGTRSDILVELLEV